MRRKNLKNREPSENASTSEYIEKNAYFILILIFLLALVFRSFAFDKIFVDGNVLFQGYDEYYHARLITYAVHNFPGYMWFDSYVDYPNGIDVGWMPLYDLTTAFIILVLGLGSPTVHTIETVAAIFPAILGALTVIPIFLIGKELLDKKLGLLSAFLFAIMPSHILVSRLGAVDHHVAETLLFALILLLIILSLKKASGKNREATGQSVKSEKNGGIPGRIFTGNHMSLAALAGVIIAVLVFTWSAAPIYIAIFSMYFIVQYGVNLYRKQASNDIMLIGAIAAFTAIAISVFLYLFHWIPLYQVAGIAVFFASVIFGWFVSNAMLKRKTHWALYPMAMVALLLIIYAAIMSSPALGQLFNGLIQFLARENITGTIAEAQPFASDFFSLFIGLYFSNPYGSTLVFAFFGVILFLLYELRSRFAPEKLLFIVCGFAVTILAFQQVRFAYLMAIFVAIFCAYFIYRGFFYRKIVNYNTVVGIILSVIIITLTAYQGYSTAKEEPAITGDWQESLLWMRNNTPATSFYDNPKEQPEYSVMSMWDYGNWIEYEAHRPVVANNFQAGAETADRFLTADTEETANAILDQRKVRYVVLDSATGFGYKDNVHGKYGSVLKVAGKNESDYYYSFEVPVPDYTATVYLLNDNYYNTIFARLYLMDGSAIENPLKTDAKALSRYRLIYESNSTWLNKTDVKTIKLFEYVPGARIKGRALPNASVSISIPVTTNRNRTFNYTNKVKADARGNFTLVVPYASEGTPYGTRPIGGYTLSVNGFAIKNISISNQQVIAGSSIDPGYLESIGKDAAGLPNIPRRTPQIMNLIWKYELGEQISDMAIKDKFIYAVSGKKIYAVDIDKKSLAWEQEFPGRLMSLEISGDRLYITTRQGLSAGIYSLDTKDGSISGMSVPGELSETASYLPVLVDDSTLYIGINKVVNAVDIPGKALKWKFTADDSILTRPTSTDNRLIIVSYNSSYNSTIYALDKDDGTLRWKKVWNDIIWSSPMVAGDTIYFGDRGGAISALDISTGEEKWKYMTGYSIDAVPVFADDTVYTASYDGKVYALNASTGETVWKSEELFPMSASPLIEGKSIFAGALNGSIYRLNKTDGRVDGICAANGTIGASPAVLDGAVYAGTREGVLYACG